MKRLFSLALLFVLSAAYAGPPTSVTVGSYVTASGTGNIQVSPTVPSGAVGDMLLLQINRHNGGGTGFTNSAGWQLALNHVDAVDRVVSIYVKFAASTDSEPSPLCEGSGSAHISAIVARFHGGSWPSIASIVLDTGTGGANTSLPASYPGLDPGTADKVVFVVGFNRIGLWTDQTAPTGFTLVTEQSALDTQNLSMASAYMVQATSNDLTGDDWPAETGGSSIARYISYGVALAYTDAAVCMPCAAAYYQMLQDN